MYKLMATASLLALGACSSESNWAQEAGTVGLAGFGNSTMNNHLVQTGSRSYAADLGARFSREVPSTVNFAFNSARLDGAAQAVLRQQADWIRQFPELTFRVYGHTDLVGSNAANKRLGLRRARAVVSYFSALGISRDRLEAVASLGETQPVVYTEGRERQNRRTVTQVSGFVKRHPTVLNGKYAAVVVREYVESAAETSSLSGNDSNAFSSQ